MNPLSIRHVMTRELETIREELEAYGAGLEDKTEIVALSKAETVDEETYQAKARLLGAESGRAPLRLSAATNEGVRELVYLIAQTLKAERDREADAAAPRSEKPAWSPI